MTREILHVCLVSGRALGWTEKGLVSARVEHLLALVNAKCDLGVMVSAMIEHSDMFDDTWLVPRNST